MSDTYPTLHSTLVPRTSAPVGKVRYRLCAHCAGTGHVLITKSIKKTCRRCKGSGVDPLRSLFR